jgi:hypothetical protein
VSELKSLGVKRIINIAAECTDDRGLMLRERFERYVHIPMRDCVEEEGVRKGLSEACDVLGKYFAFVITRRCCRWRVGF